MVQVNNYSDRPRVSLAPEYLRPYTWFEYKGMLYLAIKWETDLNNKVNKLKLLAVCFDPEHYTMEAEFYPCEIKVVIVPDSKVSIFYKIDPPK
jgi:hypothetical protein